MNVELREYQVTAAKNLLRQIATASNEIRKDKLNQAVVFSAPTGSGKTVMAASLMEAILQGNDISAECNFTPNENNIFLWLSDDPNLNEQTRRRIIQTSDILPSRLVTIDSDFEADEFEDGKIYFLNYQKLGTNSLLVKLGDQRKSTIWQTIYNTNDRKSGRFIVIMDEAHKGLSRTAAEAQSQLTLAATLISGSANVKVRSIATGMDISFPPVGMLLGISATAARFDDYLKGGADRTRRSITVTPAQVRDSGLIKDKIRLDGFEGGEPHTWTLLQRSVRKIQELTNSWKEYTTEQNKPSVVPLLMIQVQNGSGTSISATPMEEVVRIVLEEWPTIDTSAIVHCFGQHEHLTLLDGETINFCSPSDINDNPNIRVVLFKTALNTGWDCPRAEVLMSFRSSAEATNIAQLVGRMVRTPLAERVIGDATLNAAYLSLPFFSEAEVAKVKAALEAETDGVIGTETTTSVIDLRLRPDHEAITTAMSRLIVEVPTGGNRVPSIRRAFKFARLLSQDGIYSDAPDALADETAAVMRQAWDNALAANPDLPEQLEARRNLRLASKEIIDGEIVDVDEEDEEIITISDRDVDQIYQKMRVVVSPDISSEWVRRRFYEGDGTATQFKIEFMYLCSNGQTIKRLQECCDYFVDQNLQKFGSDIAELSSSRRVTYSNVLRAGRNVQASMYMVEGRVSFPLKSDMKLYKNHLYVSSTDGLCPLALNSWEERVLEHEEKQVAYIGFLRNIPRQSWAFSFPYQLNGQRFGYPDFLIFRHDQDNKVVIDILEPHQGEDSVAKMHGLADLATRYGHLLGRVEMIRVDSQRHIKRLQLHDALVRDRIRHVQGTEDLLIAFEELAVID